MSDTVAIVIAVVLLGLNAFFVGAEFSLISARRTVVEPQAAAGRRSALTTLRAMENVSLMMACAQLGITLCSLGLGAIGEPAVAHQIEPLFAALGVPEALLHPVAFVLAMSVVVFLHVVLGEMVPKNIALAGPERVALVLTPPLVLTAKLLHPVIWLTNWIANHLLRLVGVEPKDEVTSAFTRDEVAALVEQSHREGLLDEGEEKLTLGALGFADRTARSVLLPLAELTTVPADATVGDVERAAVGSGYSRFPVRDAAGGLAGYVHIKDVLTVEEDVRTRPVPARHVRPLTTVAADDRLRTVLRRMQLSGAHLARVLDDGRLLGVVALEDVLAELVGEVRASTAGPGGRSA
ncbi:hemolysin family protein [Kineococcus sp. NUM-3379]